MHRLLFHNEYPLMHSEVATVINSVCPVLLVLAAVHAETNICIVLVVTVILECFKVSDCYIKMFGFWWSPAF